MSRQQFEKQVRHKPNVTMLPLQPISDLNELLNAADVHLLPQKRDAADLVMPSKLNGILASGRPVIAIADPETQVAHVVASCGVVVPAGDPMALCAAAARLVESDELRANLGFAAREYAVKYLSKELVLRRFELEMVALLTPAKKTEDVHLARSYRS